MTEQEWLNCEDPARMITLITKGFDGCIGVPKEKQKPFQYRASDRKIKLWAKACRDLTFPKMKSMDYKETAQQAIESWSRLCGTDDLVKDRLCPLSLRANLLRELIGNPFKPIKLPTLMQCRKCSWDGTGPNQKYCEWGSDPDGKYGHDWHQYSPILTWRDSLIPKTAQGIHDNEKWEEVGILADMCEDAGCDNQDLLMHLRGKERCPVCIGQGTVIVQCDPDQHPWRTDIEMCELCGDGKEPGSGWIPLRSTHVKGCHVLDALTGRE